MFSIRYSLFSTKFMQSWRSARGLSEKDYMDFLYNKDRMDFRQNTISKITIPSIDGSINLLKNKEDLEVTVFILTSKKMPQHNQDFLEQLEQKYSFLKIAYLEENDDLAKPENDYISKFVQPDDIVASIRLDDDDAVSNNFISKIYKLMDLNIDAFAVSLCDGYGVELNPDLSIKRLGDYNSKFIAAGLAYIYKFPKSKISVYHLGTHTNIDYKIPVLVDSSFKSFIRTFHHFNDSKNQFNSFIKNEFSVYNYKDMLKIFSVML